MAAQLANHRRDLRQLVAAEPVGVGELVVVGSHRRDRSAVEQQGSLLRRPDQPLPVGSMAPMIMEATGASPQVPAEGHAGEVAVETAQFQQRRHEPIRWDQSGFAAEAIVVVGTIRWPKRTIGSDGGEGGEDQFRRRPGVAQLRQGCQGVASEAVVAAQQHHPVRRAVLDGIVEIGKEPEVGAASQQADRMAWAVAGDPAIEPLARGSVGPIVGDEQRPVGFALVQDAGQGFLQQQRPAIHRHQDDDGSWLAHAGPGLWASARSLR